MRRVLLDTNAVLSFLTNRDSDQQAAAAGLLEDAAAGVLDVWLHQLVVAEVVYVLTNHYRVAADETAAIVRRLLALPGLSPVHDLPWHRALELWPKRLSDFADACLAAVALQSGGVAIATFDASFRRALCRLGVASCF